MENIVKRLRAASSVPVIGGILNFLNGKAFPPLYAALVLLSSLTGLEFLVYGFTVAVVLFVCLFAEDTKPLIVPVVMIVYSTSWKHTPQPPYRSAFLNDPAVLSAIMALGAVAVAAMLFRLIVFRRKRNFMTAPTRLKGGLIALAAALILNGSFFADYTGKDFFLGILIALSFVAVYLFLYNTCGWNRQTGCYFAYVVGLTSVVILLQVAKLLLIGHLGTPQGDMSVFTEDGSINKDLMIAGWGMSNNIGGMLAMFMPVWLYFAYRMRHGWIFYILAFMQTGAIAFTLSRSSLLVGGVMLFAGAVLLSCVRSPRRSFFRVFNIAVIVCVLLFCIVFSEKIKEVFAVIFERGFSDSNRFRIWMNGLLNFLKAPFFGVGFYESFGVDINIENWIFPDMYHNIVIQLLASCGTAGMLAYLYHLAQVLNLSVRKPTAERILYLSIFLMITGTSFLDNHIFHVFPALVYSASLLLWEKDVEADSPLPLGRDKRGLFRFGKNIREDT